MSIYREAAGGYGDWRDLHGGKSGLELIPAYDRARAVRLLKSGVTGPWPGLARVNTLLGKLRDHLTATSGNWATFDAAELAELSYACLDLNTVGKMCDTNGHAPPVAMMAAAERVHEIVYQEFISP